MGSVRIYGGLYARRLISFDDAKNIRPTGVRIRQTLFDWLRPCIQGKRCLDVFSGSGILGFDALSQGAKHCTFIDMDRDICQMLAQEGKRLGAENMDVVQDTVPCDMDQSFDICFVDPPFSDGALLKETLDWLNQEGVLKTGSLVYVEFGQDHSPYIPESWVVKKRKKLGGVVFALYEQVR